MQKRDLLVTAVALAVLVPAAWFSWSELLADEGPRPASAGTAVEPRAQDTPRALVARRATATSKPPAPRQDPEDKSKYVRYPDGQYLPALNGVVGAPPMTWDDRPYSPVVGIRTAADGTRWYVHADGSQTTMFMAWRDDLGRMDPVVQHVRPVETAPFAGAVLPGEGSVGPVVNPKGGRKPGGARKPGAGAR